MEEDPHTVLAKALFGEATTAEDHKRQREQAKTINFGFGIQYGKPDIKHMSPKEKEAYIHAILEREFERLQEEDDAG